MSHGTAVGHVPNVLEELPFGAAEMAEPGQHGKADLEPERALFSGGPMSEPGAHFGAVPFVFKSFQALPAGGDVVDLLLEQAEGLAVGSAGGFALCASSAHGCGGEDMVLEDVASLPDVRAAGKGVVGVVRNPHGNIQNVADDAANPLGDVVYCAAERDKVPIVPSCAKLACACLVDGAAIAVEQSGTVLITREEHCVPADWKFQNVADDAANPLGDVACSAAERENVPIVPSCAKLAGACLVGGAAVAVEQSGTVLITRDEQCAPAVCPLSTNSCDDILDAIGAATGRKKRKNKKCKAVGGVDDDDLLLCEAAQLAEADRQGRLVAMQRLIAAENFTCPGLHVLQARYGFIGECCACEARLEDDFAVSCSVADCLEGAPFRHCLRCQGAAQVLPPLVAILYS
jgi:hypothetical protein